MGEESIAQLVIFGIEELIKVAPVAYARIEAIIKTPDQTPEQVLAALSAERARIARQSYEQQVPNTDLPKAGSSQAPTDAPPVQT